MFTLKELEAEVRRLAAENPGFVYQRPEGRNKCKYLSGGDPEHPGCIMGRAIVNLAPELMEFLQEMDRRSEGISELLVEKLNFDATESDWFNQVQDEQDEGVPWSEAVEVADAYCC